jgi:hypothetical protein
LVVICKFSELVVEVSGVHGIGESELVGRRRGEVMGWVDFGGGVQIAKKVKVTG